MALQEGNEFVHRLLWRRLMVIDVSDHYDIDVGPLVSGRTNGGRTANASLQKGGDDNLAQGFVSR